MLRHRTAARPPRTRCPAATRHALIGALATVALTACADREPTTPGLVARLAPDASALHQRGKPTFFNVPDEAGTFTIAAGVGCSFAVAAETVVNRLVIKTFPEDRNGDVLSLSTGSAVERFTNLQTGKSITVNVSGPGRSVAHPDGSATVDAVGTWSIFGVAAVPGGSTFFLNSGHVVIEYPPTGGPGTVVSRSGLLQDLCAALA